MFKLRKGPFPLFLRTDDFESGSLQVAQASLELDVILLPCHAWDYKPDYSSWLELGSANYVVAHSKRSWQRKWVSMHGSVWASWLVFDE